jgi:alginate O-acetyltransferase complex protein AlgI
MLFSEPIFFPFFLLCFAVRWSLRGFGTQKTFLWAASYVFYGAWDVRFLALLAGSTVVDFIVGKNIEAATTVARRRAWLVVCLCSNLGLLTAFKYFNFFTSSTVALLGAFGLSVPAPTLEVVLPVGLSFFTFQSISYVIDVYRKNIAVVRNFRDYALFVAFFPQLVAGPIMRAVDFIPQLAVPPRLRDVDFRRHLAVFCLGYFKKVCIADNIALAIDPVFAAPLKYGSTDVLLAATGYSVQIYCDFSGYSDMAIATAGLLGFRLSKNFDAPYFSVNIQEFWRRWHISLSTWLRDYLYISMGGGRVSEPKVYRNLIVTMLLGGLWHGANMTFVIWGLLHGVALAATRAFGKTRAAAAWARVPASRFIGWVLTFAWVVFCFALFRCESIQIFFDMLGRIGEDARRTGVDPRWWLVIVALGLAQFAFHRYREVLRGLTQRAPVPLYGLALGAAAALALFITPLAKRPFIYFQF